MAATKDQYPGSKAIMWDLIDRIDKFREENPEDELASRMSGEELRGLLKKLNYRIGERKEPDEEGKPKVKAITPHTQWKKGLCDCGGWPAWAVKHGLVEKDKEGNLPVMSVSTSKPANVSDEEWAAKSPEEKDECALENGNKAAFPTQRTEAWNEFKGDGSNPPFVQLQKQCDEQN